MTVALENKKFKVWLPITKSETVDGEFFITGEASNLSVDLEKDQMTQEAIDSMKRQAVGLNGYLNHRYDFDSILGTIVSVKELKTKFIPTFKVIPDHVPKIKTLLDNGVRLGLSIGGMIKEWSRDQDIRKIIDVLLLEVSLTPFPANWDTFGSVTMTSKGLPCPGGVCNQIFKSIDMKYGDTQKANYSVNGAGRSNANSRISAGDVDLNGAWSFSAADGNKLLGSNGDDWANYAKWHLAIDSSQGADTRGHYKFPFGKNGKVYRRGVIAAKSRAAQNNQTAIVSAADALLTKIDNKYPPKSMNSEDLTILSEINGIMGDSVKQLTEMPELNKEILSMYGHLFKSYVGIMEGVLVDLNTDGGNTDG
jgi:hypothetical protein